MHIKQREQLLILHKAQKAEEQHVHSGMHLLETNSPMAAADRSIASSNQPERVQDQLSRLHMHILCH